VEDRGDDAGEGEKAITESMRDRRERRLAARAQRRMERREPSLQREVQSDEEEAEGKPSEPFAFGEDAVTGPAKDEAAVDTGPDIERLHEEVQADAEAARQNPDEPAVEWPDSSELPPAPWELPDGGEATAAPAEDVGRSESAEQQGGPARQETAAPEGQDRSGGPVRKDVPPPLPDLPILRGPFEPAPSPPDREPPDQEPADQEPPDQEPPDQEPADHEPADHDTADHDTAASPPNHDTAASPADAEGSAEAGKEASAEATEDRLRRLERRAAREARKGGDTEEEAVSRERTRRAIRREKLRKARRERAQRRAQTGGPSGEADAGLPVDLAEARRERRRADAAADAERASERQQSLAPARGRQREQPGAFPLPPLSEPEPKTEPQAEQASLASQAGAAVRLVGGFFKSLVVLALVLVPAAVAAYYYFTMAADRYVVPTIFLIRHSAADQQPTVTSFLGQAASFGRAADESFSVVDYVTSYEGMLRLTEHVNLRAAYSVPKGDPLNYLPPDVSNLQLYDYYSSMIESYYDQTTGLVSIEVQAYRPRDALALSQALLRESERLVNEFNKRAEADLLRLAREEVARALADLEAAEAALTAFRQTNNVIDPSEVITRVNGIITQLEGQIALSQAELAQLGKVTGNRNSVQRLDLESRIESLKAQVAKERDRLVGAQESVGSLIPQYELLSLRKQVAGEAYSASLVSLQSAVAQAQRQQLYVVPVVSPTLPDQAQLPHRWENVFFVLLGSILFITIGRLLFLGIRDHVL